MIEAIQTTLDAANKIWYGLKVEEKYGPEESFGSVILKALQKDPENILQICYPTGKEYTNREILELSKSVAQNLEKMKIQQCEIVGICAANSDFVAPLVYGCWFRGLTISTMDQSFNKDEIKHMCSITKPKVMFCDRSCYYIVKEALSECGLIATTIYTVEGEIEGVPQITDLLKETGQVSDFTCVPLKLGYNQVAAITCSSGTSGLPKGVCISHGGFLNCLPSFSNERIFGFSCLYWSSSLLFLITSAIDCSTRVITSLKFSPENFFEIVQKHKITKFWGSPAQLGLITASPKFQQYDLSSLTGATFIGSALAYCLVRKWKELLPNVPVIVSYGLTETCSNVCWGPAIEDGSCGQIRCNMEVKIIDENGHHLGANEIGEICARYLYPWAGYYGNPKATAEIYDSEGWIHSGDLGYFDNKNFLHVIDRKKELLKYNNYHFFPTEIEKVILELNDVAEVCVFGTPDLIYSDLPTAAVVKITGSSLTEEEICQHVTERLVHYKHLHGGVYFVEELPKTNSGKILRRKVLEQHMRTK